MFRAWFPSIVLIGLVSFSVSCSRPRLSESLTGTTTSKIDPTTGDSTPEAAAENPTTPATGPANPLEGLGIIRCGRTGAIQQGVNQAVFSPNHCTSGALPSNRYVGILTHLEVPGGHSGEFTVGQPLYGQAADVGFYARAASLTGNYTVAVTYLPANSATTIRCGRTGAISQVGANSIQFLPGQCAGSPSATHLAIPMVFQANGGNSGEFIFGQPVSGQAPSVWFYSLSGQGSYNVQVLYVQVPTGSTRSCTASGPLSGTGVWSFPYSAAQCAGAVPPINSVAIPSTLLSNGGANSVFIVGQPVLGGGPSVAWRPSSASGNFSITTVYLRL